MVAEVGRKTRRDRRSLIAWLLLAPALLCAALLAAGPATKPAPQIRQWVDDLADTTPDVREKAIDHLMDLTSDDLPTLSKILRETGPLLPGQRIVLQDVVIQVFMAGMPYEPDAEGNPFIGLVWQLVNEPFVDDQNPEGIPVPTRLLGFSAYQRLREGDVLKGIGELPDIKITSDEIFRKVVKDMFKPGQTITLNILRNGRHISVPIQLRAKPAGVITADTMTQWINSRREVAEESCAKMFPSLFGDGVL